MFYEHHGHTLVEPSVLEVPHCRLSDLVVINHLQDTGNDPVRSSIHTPLPASLQPRGRNCRIRYQKLTHAFRISPIVEEDQQNLE